MATFRISAVLFCCVLFLFSCQQDSKTAKLSLSVDSLENVRWQLHSAQAFTIPTKGELVPYIEFIAPDKVSGFTGCNRFQSNVNIDNSTIHFTPLAMSKRYCMETAEVESAFVKALTTVEQGHITDNTLTLLNENGDMVLSFKGKLR
ncbi:META domain-containing protein [Thalassotalea sediminis]|uniref:META domain-containing protein n=1 Tax=Thalassotalea sediminis TaxID=1759089 RepID=UPI0025726B42|nr:META domain-containing protein [Thalassotalea sediminis]